MRLVWEPPHVRNGTKLYEAVMFFSPPFPAGQSRAFSPPARIVWASRRHNNIAPISVAGRYLDITQYLLPLELI